jgi:hypothetical protein
MAKYKVIGAHAVDGVEPGGTVDLDLPEANIQALIESGHIGTTKEAAAEAMAAAAEAAEAAANAAKNAAAAAAKATKAD